MVFQGDCFATRGRYSSTDFSDARILETRSVDVQDCQRKCQEHPKCNYFLFFSRNHYQRFKHLTCRLLRFKGTLKLDGEGHISGPKYCTSPREVDQIVKAYRQFYCNGSCDSIHQLRFIPEKCRKSDDSARSIVGQSPMGASETTSKTPQEIEIELETKRNVDKDETRSNQVKAVVAQIPPDVKSDRPSKLPSKLKNYELGWLL